MFRSRTLRPSPASASKRSGFAGLVRSFHRWCGLTAGLLLVVVALTGAGMAFRWQLEPSLGASLLRVPACTAPLPPSRLVSAAHAANPQAGALSAIRMYADPNASTRVRFGDGRWVYVDPCSGRVLGIQDAYGGFFGTLAWVHIFGYLSFGATVAGLIAFAVMAFVIAGLWLWWRSRGHRPPRSALSGGARRLQLHRSVGPWCAPVLLLLTLTGVPQAFPALGDALQAAGRAAPATPVGRATPAALAASPRPGANAIDTAWRHAIAAPWQQIQWRVGPASAGQPIKAEITAATAPHAYAAGLASYDQASGAPLQYEPYDHAATGRKTWLWALALHYGAVGGAVWPLILFLSVLSVPVLAWTGAASYLHRRQRLRPAAALNLLLKHKRMEAANVCSFEFVHPRGRKLPPWTPGAHIDIHIAPGLVRQYSLCGDPRDRSRYLIAVHRCSPSRGGSQAMHENLNEGDLVQVGTPRNQFPLADHSPHTVLLAGGIGITPLLAMAEKLSAAGASFELHYCARSAGEAAFLARLGEDRFSGRVRLHFSQGGQRVDLDTLLSLPSDGARLYICGSGTFTDAALATAKRLGWPDDTVSTERFAPAAAASTAADAQPQRAFDLLIASTGRVVHVPAEQSALEALLAAGIAIPTSCGQGVCGTCITGVLEGEPDHRDHCLSPESRAAKDCFTPCCSRAHSAHLILDL
ncbi:PepSY domain-containing protein [Pseudoduganella sp. UC29_106]|uniref:PepSY domain-containing protein n=1 Tax=Pseudoduganella sp. UC29_106 TaxID=3374553 RepID=UPI0037584761